MYQVRRVHIGKTEQLDELAYACGLLYSKTLVFFWRTVRHKGIWLAPKHLMRLWTSPKLHAHTSDACVQAFFAALSSWRERRKIDPTAHPPRRRKWYFRIEYKRSTMKLADGTLRLSNGRGNAPLVLAWPWQLPQTVIIHWTGTQYEAIATYRMEEEGAHPLGREVAGIDLGEIHMAVSHDGTQTHILNGRLLRSKRQYRNKLLSHLSKQIARKKKGSVRRKQLIRSKHKQLRKLKHQIQDIEHKQTSQLVSTLYHEGVQTVVIGDVRAIRQNNDTGSTNNQKIHQWVRPKCSFCMVPKGTTGGEKPYGQRTNRRWERQKGPKHVRKAPCLEVSFQAVVLDQGVIWLKLACLKPSVLAIMDGVYEELQETYTGEGHRNRPLVPVLSDNPSTSKTGRKRNEREPKSLEEATRENRG
jgi:putative transposase